MKTIPKRAHTYHWLLIVLFGLGGTSMAWAQPERLMYFPDTGRNYTQLDPGDEMLRRNLLLSNQSQYSVSFDLSFDQEKWNDFAAGPRFSSIYNMKNQAKCFIRIRTRHSSGQIIEVLYELIRGNCYSVYWNREWSRWDVVENACRRD